jgi:hypothetical protein
VHHDDRSIVSFRMFDNLFLPKGKQKTRRNAYHERSNAYHKRSHNFLFVCVCFASHWVYAAIGEWPDLPALKRSSRHVSKQ